MFYFLLGAYPNMLAPQLDGRLLSEVNTNPNIKSLLDQCDKEGPMQNALVPTSHCMHTPGGPLKYSLEGHLFAVFGFKITSDYRYIVSVSNKFITWDVSTSDLARQVHPGVEGLMMELEISPDSRFVAAYTNNNQVVLLNALISEYVIIDNPLGADDSVQGLVVLDTHLIIYGKFSWSLFTIAGKEVETKKVLTENPILKMTMNSCAEYSIVHWSGDLTDPRMSLHTYKEGFAGLPLEFHSAYVLNKKQSKVWLCTSTQSLKPNNVEVCSYKTGCWLKDKMYAENLHPLLQLALSTDESFLIGTIMTGFQLWRTTTNGSDLEGSITTLKLPSGIRNISTKMNKSNSCVLSVANRYAVAGIRKELYIWSVKDGLLVKCLDAHFARIIDIQPLIVGTWNCVVTSSIDRTVKVWNINYIFEAVHHIDRHELPIDSASVSTAAGLAITATRGCIGIWDLLTGKLKNSLADSSLGAIVTHATITKSGEYIMAAESGNVLYWNVEEGKVVFKEEQKNILQLVFYDDEGHCLTVSKTGSPPDYKALCISRTFPEGKKQYEFDFPFKSFKNVVMTADAQFIIALGSEKAKDTLFVYHLETGQFLHKFLVKYPNLKDISSMVAIPDKPSIVALIDQDKGNMIDVRNKKFVKAIPQWGGINYR